MTRDEWRQAFEQAPLGPLTEEVATELPVDPAYGTDEGEWPGLYPYTRGPYASMYRTKLWTMRMFAGFGGADETNMRFRDILRAGAGGLSVAFDLPTLMGRDSDDPLSEGEVGRCGVAVDTLADMEDLFAGIDLGQVTTSMTINAPAIIVLAMYVAVADQAGVPRNRLGGTTQADILKEYQAQKEFIFPPRPSMRLVTDMIEFCTAELPRWHPLSISGYHIREAGATAVEELAFTLANGFAYVESAVDRGLDVDRFAPRLSFFFNATMEFFPEIAKYRAARRLWARWMKERYGATDARSMRCRFHVQTSGSSLTAQQPQVNVVRTAIEALAGVLGGTQSLHTNALDEVLALPTERNARLALRTQQVIAYESNVPLVADPLGGSYLVESLTDEMEAAAEAILARIDAMGDGSMLEGVHAGIENGWFQGRIADSAYEAARQLDAGERIVVGVNRFTDGDEGLDEVLHIDQAVEERQCKKVREMRSQRSAASVAEALARVTQDGRDGNRNLMPGILDAVRAYATEGEIVDALAAVFGRWTEQAVL
jgi:methylmalonyl-CoA mutase N-terminal domain/subunit